MYDFYVDAGYTGTSFNRPDFERMIADIEAGRYLERYFPENGVRFISVSDSIDSIKQAYDLLLPIKNIFNEQYARDISNKIQEHLNF